MPTDWLDLANSAAAGKQLDDSHRIATEHALYRAAQGMDVKTVTVDSSGRETVVTKQLPPNVAAATAILAATAPERWTQAERAPTAIQFVIHAPAVATSTQAWLEQYGPQAQLSKRDTHSLPALVQADPGGLDPTVSGPVPDPLAVPTSLSTLSLPKYKKKSAIK